MKVFSAILIIKVGFNYGDFFRNPSSAAKLAAHKKIVSVLAVNMKRVNQDWFFEQGLWEKTSGQPQV